MMSLCLCLSLLCALCFYVSSFLLAFNFWDTNPISFQTKNKRKVMSSPSLKLKKKKKKPMSSPGRGENYPPSLMRFLRSNIKGSGRSRGRSRSSPMFIIRKRNKGSSSVDAQEPSSPTVTCMGQVRVTRSRAGRSKSRNSVHHHPCRWLHNALLCTNSRFCNTKPKYKYCALFRKWVVFFRLRFRRKVESSSKKESLCKESKTFTAAVPQQCENLVSCSPSVPPRNAFLLTRSRSAPYRSPPLAVGFRGSPKHAEEEENKNDNDPTTTPAAEDATKLCLASGAVPKSSCTDRSAGVLNPGPGLDTTWFVRPPVLLTRCKSEPARKEGIINLDFVGGHPQSSV